jgi:hypothetical protein
MNVNYVMILLDWLVTLALDNPYESLIFVFSVFIVLLLVESTTKYNPYC